MQDANALAREFHPVFTMDDYINLPRYSFYLKLLIDGATSKPFSAYTMPLKMPFASCQEEIVQLSRRKYGRSQKNVAIKPEPFNILPVMQGTLFSEDR